MVASDQKFRILSIDGGGIRGIIPCILLHRLSEQLSREFSRNFLQSIDVLAGTSTGGIIALSLAAGLDPLEILRLYMSSAQSIFEPRHLPFLRCRSPKRGLARWLNILLTMRWPKYRVENLYIELKKVFRNLTLGDLKKKVVI
ncbi:MAG: patatin-like phospholipase family protein, partial [Bryobacteraceae bacterium]|nr:patatin-like phospholipase family protein [Bryobacteraceae bacterium]